MKDGIAITGAPRVAALMCLVGALGGLQAAPAPPTNRQGDGSQGPALFSSAYPPVSADLARLWLVPDTAARAKVPRALTDLAEAIRLYADGKYPRALALLENPALSRTALADYAAYCKAVVLLRMGRLEPAQQALDALRAGEPVGYLSEAVRLRQAEAAESLGDYQAAGRIYEDLSARKTASPDTVLMALARASLASGDRERAARAYRRLYYDYPLADLSAAAGAELEMLRDALPVDPAQQFKADLSRAQRLMDARRFAAAETAFQALLASASGDDRERVSLRLAECRFHARRYREAVDDLQPWLDRGSRKAEALFFSLLALRELGRTDDYVRLSRQLVSEHPTSSWSEDALNNLASYHIVNDDDEQADQVFRELHAKFPKGRYAERAAWKIGWWAYKHARYAETVKFFEQTAAAFPHSDYRPAYLYWAARAHESLGAPEAAHARYRLVLTDYRNTYYGRLTTARFREHRATAPEVEPVAILKAAPADPALPPTAERVRLLLALNLPDQAMDELQCAQRTWGDLPIIAATMAYVYNRRGELRTGITVMRRTYPQYMAAGGEHLPVEIRKVMYPVDYWTSIRTLATGQRLDPYLVASLILQESTFSPVARSSANAVGLMQILEPTGRHYARSLRIRRFSPAMLTWPDTNLRLGIAYFSDLVKRFGGDHFALASYNAGEHRVAQWIAERPGLSREEFIDDIPFPETQNYVKRILGCVEDYRTLYGSESATKTAATPAVKKTVTPR